MSAALKAKLARHREDVAGNPLVRPVVRADEMPADEFFGDEQVANEAPPACERVQRRPMSQIISALASRGKVVRLPTGVPSFDSASLGGIQVPRLVIVGGAPGACKTSLMTWLAWSWARRGVPVVFLAIDEDSEGIVYRLAQLEGADVRRLDEGDASEWARVTEKLTALPINILDADDDGHCVEEAAAWLDEMRPKGSPCALIVDSAQTVRAIGTDDADSMKSRVEAVVRGAKAVTKRIQCVTLLASELARGSYRSRNVAEQTEDLAAFKESGAIEYAAQTAFVLRSVPDDQLGDEFERSAEHHYVDVTTPKNRRYGKPNFRLRMDHKTTNFVEVEMPEKKGPPTKLELFNDLKGEILALVRRHPGEFKSANAIESRVTGTRSAVLGAVKELLADKALVNLDGFRVLS